MTIHALISTELALFGAHFCLSKIARKDKQENAKSLFAGATICMRHMRRNKGSIFTAPVTKPSMSQVDILHNTPERLGFSSGGAISSRTAMLDELASLLEAVPVEADAQQYRQAILEGDVLQKKTASNREKTFKFLRSLYALDPRVCLFREMRRLSRFASDDRKLLIGLLALAREPILRGCLTMVLKTPIGESMGRAQFEAWIRAYMPGKYSESMFISFSHNLYACFYQFGYLGDAVNKARTRIRPKPGIASVTFAAFLDWLNGMSGVALIQGEYSRALDVNTEEHIALLQAAGRQGLLRAAYSGGVLDLAFPGFLKDNESRVTL